MGESKGMRLITTIAMTAIFALSACSQKYTSPEDEKYDLTPAQNSCNDFPVVIYPSTTKKTCEKNTQYENAPVSYTAYVESKDSVDKVTKFYKTQVQKSGWKVEPVKVESSTHSVVTIKRDLAYASIIINTGKNKKGSSFEIQAYPFGN